MLSDDGYETLNELVHGAETVPNISDTPPPVQTAYHEFTEAREAYFDKRDALIDAAMDAMHEHLSAVASLPAVQVAAVLSRKQQHGLRRVCRAQKLINGTDYSLEKVGLIDMGKWGYHTLTAKGREVLDILDGGNAE